KSVGFRLDCFRNKRNRDQDEQPQQRRAADLPQQRRHWSPRIFGMHDTAILTAHLQARSWPFVQPSQLLRSNIALPFDTEFSASIVGRRDGRTASCGDSSSAAVYYSA